MTCYEQLLRTSLSGPKIRPDLSWAQTEVGHRPKLRVFTARKTKWEWLLRGSQQFFMLLKGSLKFFIERASSNIQPHPPHSTPWRSPRASLMFTCFNVLLFLVNPIPHPPPPRPAQGGRAPKPPVSCHTAPSGHQVRRRASCIWQGSARNLIALGHSSEPLALGHASESMVVANSRRHRLAIGSLLIGQPSRKAFTSTLSLLTSWMK